MDDSGTIDPAALNAPHSDTIAPNLLSQPSPRGVKRARSPELDEGTRTLETRAGDVKASKRSKPLNVDGLDTSSQTMPLALPPQPVRTPHIETQSLPQMSPQRSIPGSASKPAVVKALPTVRDHTTDQLNAENDEYIPRETDPGGETKVSPDGYPLEGRKYKCRTFQVPNRGEKLFMLATECARVLGYRDSYLLFNKNRSLYKIIANQQEKDNLIHQEILAYSYRSRQIAIVTARSMFRQFGSRLIDAGRRVRDDYWEAKARKQGFTEDDLAGEKRPGAAKAREAAAAEASSNALMPMLQGEIIYSNGPGFDGHGPGMHPVTLAPAAPLPMIHLAADDVRPGSGYGNVIRPRHEITGPPYHDRTQSSSSNDILSQASQAAEYNKQLAQTRAHRAKYLDDYWERPHEQPVTQPELAPGASGTVHPQQLQSPQAVAGMSQSRAPPDSASHPGSQMISQAYGGYTHQQNPMASPVQQMHRQVPPSQMHQGSPSMSMGAIAGHRQTPSYGYGTGQVWQPPQPQQSPVGQGHPLQYVHQQQQQQQHHSPMPPPQMPPQPNMGYGQLTQMGAAAYAGMNRNLYQQPSPSPQQHFAMGPMSGDGQQPGMPGWSTTPNTTAQDWQRYQ
ncbi:hypothetical protein LTR91_007640 [Friedmanniomyces endolithicus]|uniref:Uncharacterized protein n=1 Tax=Friedmanniomyces endolithicus TaxID=329885 RepID=A0AAN6FFQ7_9PEZI|nr:hypothetical protein LTR82_013663 [Friedmanniomyces endolithicus]KAK0913657.1 hypothetical protein LTR57_014308 [Friedmanniomyces endolithicus]KAK0957811.1 hypothetical protein LTS01_022197 [Friedmanniomyces endolithicus]KAK0991482.1 hypothetical protein LTR54_011850 [Friedmanniomyces endolithicus]KAK0994268.1 hypothetical protein LTR91_007640 [Friedmanniomyces endolithicus]